VIYLSVLVLTFVGGLWIGAFLERIFAERYDPLADYQDELDPYVWGIARQDYAEMCVQDKQLLDTALVAKITAND
jgi:hypothetical protein